MIKGCKINNILSISKLHSFFRKTFQKGYVFKGECHDFYEVVCVVNGKVGITSGKKIYELSEGEMTLHTPGEFHAIREENNENPTVIIFSFSAISFPKIKENVFCLTQESLVEIEQIYLGICKCVNKVDSDDSMIYSLITGKEIELSILVKRLELLLLKAFQTAVVEKECALKPTSEAFYNILSVMEANLDVSLSVSEIANQCRISVPTLEKTVNKYLGYGAITHYNVMKMQKAKTMLIEGKSVKDTALSLGFSNQNYFSARFKKHFGCAPSKIKSF